MIGITLQRQGDRQDPYKYYGHWPFIRYLGLEEPASVLFSFCNLIPNLAYFPHFFVSVPFTSYSSVPSLAPLYSG